MASAYQTLDVEQLIQIGIDEQQEEAVPSCSATNDDHFMRWTDECVKLLITLYQAHEPKFADVNFKNKSVWETIAAEMKKKGYNPTAVQCANKWKQLKKSFVEVEDNKRATGRGKKTCKFYYELANILGYKPGVNPVATASNSGRGEITEEKSKVKNEGTGEEGTEDQRATKKRKRSDNGRTKASSEAILRLIEECKEERKAREERQFAYLQKMHEDKMKIVWAFLEILKK
ncbi:uncharacterized protein [Montipora foliosa]|uniref:uncharacterized protein n=1 Tax=Montipora foliosa TaxID=591990 RepID=UPI0035F2071B